VNKGEKINRLTLLQKKKDNGSKLYHWLFQCDCGQRKWINYYSVEYGDVKSCGCYARERATVHGQVGTRIYSIWGGMKDRCNNPKAYHYDRYGGRGITYTKRWEKFINFYEDMKEGYRDDLSIDRIDNDGNYCKSNCRWATNVEQAYNTSRTKRFLFEGERLTSQELYARVDKSRGLTHNQLVFRLWAGWTTKEAVYLPVNVTRSELSLYFYSHDHHDSVSFDIFWRRVLRYGWRKRDAATIPRRQSWNPLRKKKIA
jgi:hypothetical protein